MYFNILDAWALLKYELANYFEYLTPINIL